MAKRNTTLLRFFIGLVAIGHATDQQLNFTKVLNEVTSKDSGDYKELMSGTKSGTGSSSGFYAEDLVTLYDWFNDDETATMTLTDEIVGHETFVGEAYCNEFSINASGDNQRPTYSVSFEFTGSFGRV